MIDARVTSLHLHLDDGAGACCVQVMMRGATIYLFGSTDSMRAFAAEVVRAAKEEDESEKVECPLCNKPAKKGLSPHLACIADEQRRADMIPAGKAVL